MSDQQNKIASTQHMPFDGGMDQRTHPLQTQAPAVLEAVNVRYNKLGGVEKRSGLRRIALHTLDNAPFIPGQGKLIGFDNELLAIDNFKIASYTKSLVGGTGPSFINKGKVPEATSIMKPVDSTQYKVYQQDTCYSSDGLLFHAFSASTVAGSGTAQSIIYSTVEDISTGSEILSNFPITVSGLWWAPNLVSIGNLVVIFWRDNIFGAGALTNIYYRIWNTGALTWSPQVTLRTDSTQDISVCSDGINFIYILDVNASGKLRITRYNTLLIQVSTILCSETAGGLGFALGICATPNEFVWISYLVGLSAPPGAIKAASYATDLSFEATPPFIVYTQSTSFLATSAPARVSVNTAVISIGLTVASLSSTASLFPVVTAGPPGAVVGNASAANRTTFWAAPASRPFIRPANNLEPMRGYMWVYCGGADGAAAGSSGATTPFQYTYMLIDIGVDDTTSIAWNARPICWHAPRYANQSGTNLQVTFWAPPNVARLSSTQWSSDFIIRRNNRLRTSLSKALTDFSGNASKFQSAKLGQTLFMTPGFYWDRSKLAEISFAYWPQTIKLTTSTTGGFLASGLVRFYRIMYEDVDSNGFVHRSIPSDAFSITTGAGATNSVTIQMPCDTITSRQGPGPSFTGIRIVVYVQDPTSGFYFRVFAEGQDPLNDPTKATITVVDTGAAADPNPEELYTDSGVFPNVMPSSFTSCVTYRNRVWVAYGHTLLYSKAFVTGDTVNFTDAFELMLEETGDITAIWVMDDTLYASTIDRIYYLQANGPNDFGQQNDIDTPNRVATDFGCIDQRSVAVTQIGTLYQSRAGFQLMSRARAVDPEPIGSRIQLDQANFPTVISANVNPLGRIVTFGCTAIGGSLGIRTVYDYALNKWSRDTVVSSDSEVSGTQIYSEATAGGSQYLMAYLGSPVSPSAIYVEDPTSNLDDGSWVRMCITMGEIHPLGLQGNMSFTKWTHLHERLDPYNLVLSWYKDYSPTPYLTQTILDTTLAALTSAQFSTNTSIHRAESMRIKVLDQRPVSGVTTGKGARWIGLAVELDPIDQKTYHLPTENKS